MGVSQLHDNYAALHSGFRWHVPKYFNIAQVCCTRWAQQTPAAMAIRIHQPGAAQSASHSYAELQAQANRLSNVLRGLGVQRGDRVAIVLPQRFETAVAYMAVLQMGAVAMPLSQLFGPEALAYRLQDSGAAVAVCDAAALAKLRAILGECPQLRAVLWMAAAQAEASPVLERPDVPAAGPQRPNTRFFEYKSTLAKAKSAFAAIKTKADEAAVLIYTSGTTGPPKGALIPHRALIGNLPGFVCSQNWFGFDPTAITKAPSPAPGMAGEGAGTAGATPSLPEPKSQSVFWSPADWAWTGGLMDALLPTLYFGRPIVAFAGRFSPQTAFELMAQHGVTHTFLFPTALKAMMKACPAPRDHFKLQLQAIMSAGEAVGDAVFAYCQQQLGVTVNEMFGQTEINYIVGNCAMSAAGPPQGAQVPSGGSAARAAASVGALGWPAKPGSMGRPYPGHRVAVIDEQGNVCPPGVPGDVALHRFDVHGQSDPIFFLGYWNNPAATQAKFTGKNGTGDWCRTGDMATQDADGYLWYQGRADDVFKAAGYRIGPSEIENCLVKHPAVANAAVVPKPDTERGAVVKAYVVLAPEYAALRAENTLATAEFDANLCEKLQFHVRQQLAPYEYPKEIEFIDALPMTTTGKVMRRELRLEEMRRYQAALAA
ncbi:MAG: acyl-CoA synthetase [Burkholderiaceae bacterium]